MGSSQTWFFLRAIFGAVLDVGLPILSPNDTPTRLGLQISLDLVAAVADLLD
ncbi:hypothetical protein [Pseudorhizobium marinum]|uniref:hypothetical protein n=1 Tax=Pseudorhizobium marinum TaxID=1496690 RepID=UPI000ADBED72|nr:hypothetical protein [Pseudorhizobium marinum]MDY6963938.1 hypothetical protein [Pseudomonadota bacterium]